MDRAISAPRSLSRSEKNSNWYSSSITHFFCPEEQRHMTKAIRTYITQHYRRQNGFDLKQFTSDVWRGRGCCLRKATILLTEEGDESARRRSCNILQLTPWPTVPRLLITGREQCQHMHIERRRKRKTMTHFSQTCAVLTENLGWLSLV